MTLDFRNLVLLGLLLVTISSLSISSQSHGRFNNHMLSIHQAATRYVNHQQADADPAAFVNNIQTIISLITKSIQPAVPAIIQTKNLPTFAFSRSTCEGLKPEQKTQLLGQVEQAKKQVTDFKKNVKVQKVNVDADNSLQYLEVIRVILGRNCQDIVTLLIGPTPYQTNLNTQQQWILGGITYNDLVKSYIQTATENNNITNCGLNTPFWTGLTCIACSDPTPIFNIATSKCVACPAGTTFDDKTKTCAGGAKPKTFKPNKASEPNLIGKPEDVKKYLSTGDQECPKDKPFVKDNACIACPADKPSFNIQSKNCQAAAKPKTFKPNKASEPNLIGKPEDIKTYLNTGDQECPKDKPFVKDNACIACPADKPNFNIQSKSCQAPKVFKPNKASEPNLVGKPEDVKKYLSTGDQECPKDKPFVKDNACIACPADKPNFNIQSKNCQAPKIFKPNKASQPSLVGKPEDIKKYLSTGDQECPILKPFVKDNVCIQCPSDKPLFNILSKQCEPCPTGKTFDFITKTCTDVPKVYKPNPAAEPSVLVPDTAPADALKKYMDTGKDVCPVAQPFVKDNNCIPCPTDKPLFNLISKACQACPPQHQFDPKTHKCIKEVPIATDVPTQWGKLVMNEKSTSADWDKYVAENVNKPLCPVEKPFWTGKQCIPCKQTELFNIIDKKCMVCPAGQQINASTHKCEPAKPLQPKLIDLFNAIF